jgi:hypothetical protein
MKMRKPGFPIQASWMFFILLSSFHKNWEPKREGQPWERFAEGSKAQLESQSGRQTGKSKDKG